MRKQTLSGGSGLALSSVTRSGCPTTTSAMVTPLPTSAMSWRGSIRSGSSSPSGTLSAAVSVLRSLATTPGQERCGTCHQTSSSGSPTTSPTLTGRSRKAPPPTGCGIIFPKRASSPVPAGSPPRPARQAAGASPRSRRMAPRHRHPTETISKRGAEDLKLTTPTNGRDGISTRIPVGM